MMSADRFKTFLVRLLENPRVFLASGDAPLFISDLRQEIAPTVMRVASGWRMPYANVDDAVAMILVGLVDNPGSCQLIVSHAADPYAYLRKCVLDWVGNDTGRSHFMWNGQRQRAVLTKLGDLPAREDSHDDDSPTIASAVASTVDAIRPRTPLQLAQHLPDAVLWLAENPAPRGHENQTLVAAATEFPLFSAPALSAVANISWGGRPNQAATSLLGAFLRYPAFEPLNSPTHFRALRLYQQRIRASV